MKTKTPADVDHFFESIINTYEERIQKIQNAFQFSENITESSHSLFDNVHYSLSGLKKERELVNIKLCEILAKNGSLRKKDYHTMMSGILDALEKKEKEAESQFLHFIESQRETANTLKNCILEIKDMPSSDNTRRIADIRLQLNHIIEQQDHRKQAVIKTFIDFQNLHNKMMDCLNNLLDHGDQVMIRDLKIIKNQMIEEINHQNRLSSEYN